MRPVAGSAHDAGTLDGRVDGINGRKRDPIGRWLREHGGRPNSEYREYHDAYLTAYTDAAVAGRRDGWR